MCVSARLMYFLRAVPCLLFNLTTYTIDKLLLFCEIDFKKHYGTARPDKTKFDEYAPSGFS